MAKNEVKEELELLIKEIKDQESSAINEFNESLNNIHFAKLQNKFNEIENKLKVVLKTDINGFIVVGDAGLGKTYNILRILKENKIDFAYSNGFTTTLELYHFLFENRDKVIFFDDDDIFRNKVMLSLLKSALYSATGKRLVSYKSTTSKLKVPSQFIFNGKLICALNTLDQTDNDMIAVLDRIAYCDLEFSFDDKIELLRSFAELDYKDLTKEEREMIFNFLYENVSQATKNLNLRLLNKLYEVYLFDKENFKTNALSYIENDEDVELIIQVLNDNYSVSQAEYEWCKRTGQHRSTFYRKMKRVGI